MLKEDHWCSVMVTNINTKFIFVYFFLFESRSKSVRKPFFCGACSLFLDLVKFLDLWGGGHTQEFLRYTYVVYCSLRGSEHSIDLEAVRSQWSSSSLLPSTLTHSTYMSEPTRSYVRQTFLLLLLWMLWTLLCSWCCCCHYVCLENCKNIT